MHDTIRARAARSKGRTRRFAALIGLLAATAWGVAAPAYAQDSAVTPAAPPAVEAAPTATTAPPPAADPTPTPAASPSAETAPTTTTDAPAAQTTPAANPSAPDATDTTAGETPPATSASPTEPAAAPDAATPAAGPAATGDEAATPEATPSTTAEPAASSAETPTATAEPPPQGHNVQTGLPHDLSPWGMYEAADIVVKAVMIGLVFACFITWTVWLAKTIELSLAKTRIRRAIARISDAKSLNEAVLAFGNTGGTGAVLVREAAEEVERSARVIDHVDDHGVKERVTSRLSRVEASAHRRMTLGTGVLATIGATAPFVGLFGTVWGIMNSFIGIAQSQTTNLAVVAPGIAEALLATAIGLVAAIPAVVIYNVFSRSIAGYKLMVADASAAVERLVSHELDMRRLWQTASTTAKAAE